LVFYIIYINDPRSDKHQRSMGFTHFVITHLNTIFELLGLVPSDRYETT